MTFNLSAPTSGGAAATAAFLALLTAAPAALAQTTTPLPPLAKAAPLALPPVVEKTLPNGLKIVLLEDHKQPAIWMRLAVPAGVVRDTPEKSGLAQMTAGLLDKGTATRTEDQIADTIDGLGASLSATAGPDHLIVAGNGLSTHTTTLFDLLADVSLRPVFPQTEIDRYKTRTVSAIQTNLSNPGTLADAAGSRLLFGAHPYGSYASGTPETLPTITQADLLAFHKTYFAPNAATLFLVGDISVDQAVREAERVLGAWEKKTVPPAPPAPVVFPRAGATITDNASDRPVITIVDRPGAAQTEIRVGMLTPGYNDPRRIAGSVATAVLGLGQFEGRLTREIRVKRGLTYGAASRFDRRKDAGSFGIGTFTKNASTGEVVKIALAEAQKLATQLTPTGELGERKTFLQGSFAVSVATPEGVLARLIPAVLYGEGPSDLTRQTGRIEAVTPQQIQDVMRSLPLGRAQIVLVGDAKAIETDVKTLNGTITVIAPSDLSLAAPTLRRAATSAPQTPAASQAPAAPAASSAADAVAGKALLDATIKAHGGEAFLNVKSLSATGAKGTLSPPGQAGFALPLEGITLTAVSPDKSRLDLKSAFGAIAFASRGANLGGWVQLPTGQIQDLPAEASSSADPSATLRAAAKKSLAVRALTPDEAAKPIEGEELNGKTLTGFAITGESGRASRFYVEADTRLVRRIVAQGAQGGEAVTLLGAYKSVEGVQLPGTMRVRQNGTDFLSLSFDTWTVNKPVADTLFDKPAASQSGAAAAPPTAPGP